VRSRPVLPAPGLRAGTVSWGRAAATVRSIPCPFVICLVEPVSGTLTGALPQQKLIERFLDAYNRYGIYARLAVVHPEIQ
jgi:hypothetical protein